MSYARFDAGPLPRDLTDDEIAELEAQDEARTSMHASEHEAAEPEVPDDALTMGL